MPNSRNRLAPPKVTMALIRPRSSRCKLSDDVPCFTEIFVDTYLPPITAKAVQHECPTIVPSVTRYTFYFSLRECQVSFLGGELTCAAPKAIVAI